MSFGTFVLAEDDPAVPAIFDAAYKQTKVDLTIGALHWRGVISVAELTRPEGVLTVSIEVPPEGPA